MLSLTVGRRKVELDLLFKGKSLIKVEKAFNVISRISVVPLLVGLYWKGVFD
jgi:hypothetical protein